MLLESAPIRALRRCVLGPPVALSAVIVLASAGEANAAAGAPRIAEGELFDEARAVLERRCLACHGGAARESGLSFADAGTFARGGARGPVFDAAAPEE
ncbi:MAG: c-type cytochrome domain-containing protein, partial [Planctomycetota bacterium]